MIPRNHAVVIRIESSVVPRKLWWAVVDQRRAVHYRPQTTLSHAVYQFMGVDFVCIQRGTVPQINVDEYVLLLRREGQIFNYEPWPSLDRVREH